MWWRFAGFVGVGRLDATVAGGDEFGRMSQAAGGRMSRFSMIADDANHRNRFNDSINEVARMDDSAHGDDKAAQKLKTADIQNGYQNGNRDDSAHGKTDGAYQV